MKKETILKTREITNSYGVCYNIVLKKVFNLIGNEERDKEYQLIVRCNNSPYLFKTFKRQDVMEDYSKYYFESNFE